jgi:sugar (pentulose or hexulose) kinase
VPALIGLDIGTGGARALAVSESGEVIAAAAQEYPVLTPRPGWTEQNPEDWWQASRKVLAMSQGRRADRPDARVGVPRRQRSRDPTRAALE